MKKENKGMREIDLFLMGLALLFIGLKLTGVITWSWWFVLLPLYGPFLIISILAMMVAILALICVGMEKIKNYAKRNQ